MKKPRIKLSLPTLATRDDAERAMHDLAATLNSQRVLIARRDAYILEVQNRYSSDLACLDQTIKEKTDALRAWAEANPAQFPKDRKSLVMAAGTLGFRTGTPKLALLNRSWTWEKVLSSIRSLAPAFIRKKEEVDKDSILAVYSDDCLFDADLKNWGLRVTQAESFFVEPDLTPFEAKQTQPL